MSSIFIINERVKMCQNDCLYEQGIFVHNQQQKIIKDCDDEMFYTPFSHRQLSNFFQKSQKSIKN